MSWDDAWIQVLSWWEAGGWTQAVMIFAVGWLSSHVIRWLFRVVVSRVARHTKTSLDDALVEVVRLPVGWTVQVAAAWLALRGLGLGETVGWVVDGVLGTVMIGMWTLSGTKASAAVLDHLVRHSEHYTFVNVRTMPALELAGNLFLYGGAAFLVCEAWDIDSTGWLASAGVVGIAVGFASQDTLANLVAGVAILADAPYKIGDFLQIDAGVRGRVVDIGIRTTRLLTNAGVEIVVPNSTMASSRIVNQSGGPAVHYRVEVAANVAYGSNVDQVRAILLEVARSAPGVVPEPQPVVLFRSMGDSALVFGVCVWNADPQRQDVLIDALNTGIYNALRAANVEIPYPKRDVYVHHVGASG